EDLYVKVRSPRSVRLRRGCRMPGASGLSGRGLRREAARSGLVHSVTRVVSGHPTSRMTRQLARGSR
ncbi:MAG TPA: hypothetical protein VIJ35_24105, partial [Bradyrhizobium sp.]